MNVVQVACFTQVNYKIVSASRPPPRPLDAQRFFGGGVLGCFLDKGKGLVFGVVPRLQAVPRAEAWAPLMTLQALNLEGEGNF